MKNQNLSAGSLKDWQSDAKGAAPGSLGPFEQTASSKKFDRPLNLQGSLEPTSLVSSQRSHPDSEMSPLGKKRATLVKD